MLIYILKQSLIARPEKHHVVRKAGPGAFDTEMDKEKAGRPSLALQYFGLATATDGMAEQIAIAVHDVGIRSEEHTSELQSLMRISYAVFCLKKKKQKNTSKQST